LQKRTQRTKERTRREEKKKNEQISHKILERFEKTKLNEGKLFYILRTRSGACRLELLKVLAIHRLVSNSENSIILLIFLELRSVSSIPYSRHQGCRNLNSSKTKVPPWLS